MDFNLPYEGLLQILDFERNINPPQVRRNLLKDYSNPFEFYSEMEFIRRFRFNKDLTKILIEKIYPNSQDDNETRGGRVPHYLRVLISLRFYATSSFQIVIGDIGSVNQGTVSRIVSEVSINLTKLLPEKIHFDQRKLNQNKEEFMKIADFPGVIGCIDCTHIYIKSPGGNNAEVFRDRSGKFSINVQAVCDPNMILTDLVVRWPGSTHDSRIFQNSRVLSNFESGLYGHGHLLGDGGYACSKYILTPFRNPTTPAQKSYNKSQIRTRGIIERCFGVMKRRFPAVQRQLNTGLRNTLCIITAVGVLHNYAMQHRLLEIDDDNDDEPPEELIEENHGEYLPDPVNGKRDALVANYF